MATPSHDYLDVPLVREHVRSAAKMVGVEMETAFLDEMLQRIDMNAGEGPEPLAFDSPLELVFWVWWQAFTKFDFYMKGLSLQRHVPVDVLGQRYVIDFVVMPQRSAYRKADRLLPYWPLVGIELDGHAFHEKTLEQVTYRNQRDRALQQSGWHIFHYSFSELTTEPSAALIEVIDYVREREMLIVRDLLPREQKES